MIEQILLPTADGAYQEVPYPARPHYNTYAEAEYQTWVTDTYVMQNPSRDGVVTNVRVQFSGYARPYQSGYQKGKTVIYKSGSARSYGSEETLNNGSYADYYTDYAVNPWTSASWSWDDIDLLEAGFALISKASNPYANGGVAKLIITSIPMTCGGGSQIIGLELL